MMAEENFLVEWWKSLGPVGPCAVLFLIGVILLLSLVFNWKWLYPKKTHNYNATSRRILVLVAGILCIICSGLFYYYRDIMHWN